MNVLLTCAGRRNYLVDYFKEALNGEGEVYVLNSNTDSASMIAADEAIEAPFLYAPNYINFVLDVCTKYDIKLVVSLFDIELPILSRQKKMFESKGILLAVSDEEVIRICNDKLLTIDYLNKMKLPTLYTTTILNDAIEAIINMKASYPLFIKPRWGMGSIAIHMVENEEELRVLYNKIRKDIDKSYIKHYDSIIVEESILIQERAKGQEYGLDIINDMKGNYITTFVKMKIEMRSGETDVAMTVANKALYDLGAMIGKDLKHIGNLDVDVFWDGSKAVVLEMNARFGGGYPFSHLAGANIPKAYISWAKNEVPEVSNFVINTGVKSLKGIKMLSFK